mmetsp:Transcript_30716/g.89998  ORF Transcript_30716/g.89998 Transcript_30716/m.89998 type:complete len:419 (+) Transcript_30716:545-1801(+)
MALVGGGSSVAVAIMPRATNSPLGGTARQMYSAGLWCTEYHTRRYRRGCGSSCSTTASRWSLLLIEIIDTALSATSTTGGARPARLGLSRPPTAQWPRLSRALLRLCSGVASSSGAQMLRLSRASVSRDDQTSDHDLCGCTRKRNLASAAGGTSLACGGTTIAPSRISAMGSGVSTSSASSSCVDASDSARPSGSAPTHSSIVSSPSPSVSSPRMSACSSSSCSGTPSHARPAPSSPQLITPLRRELNAWKASCTPYERECSRKPTRRTVAAWTSRWNSSSVSSTVRSPPRGSRSSLPCGRRRQADVSTNQRRRSSHGSARSMRSSRRQSASVKLSCESMKRKACVALCSCCRGGSGKGASVPPPSAAAAGPTASSSVFRTRRPTPTRWPATRGTPRSIAMCSAPRRLSASRSESATQ